MSDRRLIEVELPLKAVNAESAREKSLRHGHISTMHLWWARRPLAMSRAVVFGTLLPDPGDEGARKEVLAALAAAAPFEESTRRDRIEPLRRLLAEAYPDGPPKVLDCFAGGGAIPLEALRLGCDTTALDLNPVAHLIQRAVLEWPQLYGQPGGFGGNPLSEDVVRWAAWVRDRVTEPLARLFPADECTRRPAVYFWARTMNCPNPDCRATIPLLSSCWLANSGRRTVWVKVTGRRGQIDLDIRTEPPPDGANPSMGTVKASSVTCPGCGNGNLAKDVRTYGKEVGFGRLLYAVLDIDGRSRTYRSPRPHEIEAGYQPEVDALDLLPETPDGTSAVPDEVIDEIAFRELKNLIFGYRTWRSLFTTRQSACLAELCEAVRAAHLAMIAEGMEVERARSVATYLALAVDRVADRNSSFCGWDIGKELVRNTFPRQAIAMAWDFTEIDPIGSGPGSWNGAVRWIMLAIRHCSTTGAVRAQVQQGNAQDLPFADATFDAVIVDPPYYFSVAYADLSNFFYVWLKRSVGHLYPSLFATPQAPKQQEVIQNRANPRHARYISADEFERRLERSLAEIVRVAKPQGIIAIVFAHTDVRAWERLLSALRSVGLLVTTSWPMRSEMGNRPLARVKAALGSSVVLVCRPHRTSFDGYYDDVVRALDARIAQRLDAFEEMGLVGADYFVSAIGPAFEVFARFARVVRLSGEEVGVADLMVLARQAVARHALRRLLGADPLTALDPPSLFYLTWRWAFLTASIPADEAYKLERAFDVDLGQLSRPGGIVRQTGSTFAVLGPQERDRIRLSIAPPLVDVLHVACQLWDAGRRRELADLLGATGMGVEPGFWAMARALAEILPDGTKERTLLLGLGGNRDALAEAAARSAATVEQLELFQGGGA